MSKSIIICGDRNWTGRRTIYWFMEKLPSDVRIITGGAKGADAIAENIRVSLDLDGKVYPANWTMFGKAAGPIRNRRMIEDESPYLVVGFHDNISRSRGTKNMLLLAKKRKIRYQVRKMNGAVFDNPKL